jgi:tRNA G18 (ribose-2'-O)-methylase SpoU
MNRYNDEGASSSSTSQSSQQTETDDDKMIAIVLSEEYANLDNAVAKRLSSLSSIPVTNPINSLLPPSLSLSHSLSQCLNSTLS